MLNVQPQIAQLMLNWDHDDVVRVRAIGPRGFLEGTAPYRALQDLCNAASWTLVAGDLVMVRESSETYRVRGIRERVDLRIPHIEIANALAQLGR